MSDPQVVEETQLLEAAQSGDATAFGQLYERYAERVFRFLYSHMSDRMDAEDLTEEVFIRIWRSMPNYRQQGVPFISFVFRIARNALIDHYRKVGRKGTSTSLDSVVLHDHKPGPAEHVDMAIESQELRQVMSTLREDYRTVLVLRFLNELSPEETAQVMGRSSGAVRVLQHRALSALRDALEVG